MDRELYGGHADCTQCLGMLQIASEKVRAFPDDALQ